jgi:hypothetical protein
MNSILQNKKLWFGLAFTLALAIRLLRLGEMPLSDAEAAWALQAFDLARGRPFEFGPQPGYVNLTAFFFFILQAGNFAARLVPALVGSTLVLAPALFRDRLGGDRTAILLAFLLALDPGLLALSRMAGGPILAVSLVLLAWGLWRNGYLRLGGFLAGLALLSGSALWPGLLGLGLAFGLLRLLGRKLDFSYTPAQLRQGLYFALGAYLLFGSFFLLAPGGLGAGLASLPDALTRFTGWDGALLVLPLTALLFYQFPALVLALVTLARLFVRRDSTTIFLGLWLLVSFLLAVLPPARQVADLAWTLVPLWALAALEIARWLQLPERIVELHTFPVQGSDEMELRPVEISSGFWETFGMAVLTILLILFAWLNFASAALVNFLPEDIQLRWILIAGALALLALSIFLVGFGWSVIAALRGFVWGALVIGAINLVAMASFAAQLRPYPTLEMWPIGPQSPSMGVISQQANEISQMGYGTDAQLRVTLVGVDSPALRWQFRDWQVTVADAISFDANPDIIITPADSIAPELEASYRGATFSLRAFALWEFWTTSEWLRWAINHNAPDADEYILFWARNDLFPE